jgi:nifR3 family TIM-barrel protein
MFSFWSKLKKPFFCLAPMADVTDVAYRQIIAKYSRHGEKGGGPDVFWTEFVSADGLCHEVGRKKLLKDLEYREVERPIVAQLFTANPETMREAAALAAKLGFDGIDINMGCPDRSVEKQGAGAALIKNQKQARAVIRGAIDGASGLPVSVKTRTGYNKRELSTWIPELLKEDISALTIHARTRKEMSDVPARWEDVRTVVEMVRASGKNVLVIGNGDVKDLSDARVKAEFSGADGVMLGRAIFGNPWLFDETRRESVHWKDRLDVLIEHANLFEELLGGVKNFAVMRKHFKSYVCGWDGAKELREKLMTASSAKETEEIVRRFLDSLI